jgi:flavin-dependent dehydrogenase
MSRTVVIMGGGYGGAAVAKALDSEAEANVVLIDPRDAFISSAGSLRALAQPDWAPSMFFPFAKIVPKSRLIRDRATSVDPGGVTLSSGERVEADYLVREDLHRQLTRGRRRPAPLPRRPHGRTRCRRLTVQRRRHLHRSLHRAIR